MTDESSRTDNEKWDYKSKNSIAVDEETASGSFDSEAENTKIRRNWKYTPEESLLKRFQH